MKLGDMTELYDVIVANPRLGSHKEGRSLPYNDAKQKLITTYEEYRTPMSREEPQNVDGKWIGKNEAKITNSRTGLVIFFYLRSAGNKE